MHPQNEPPSGFRVLLVIIATLSLPAENPDEDPQRRIRKSSKLPLRISYRGRIQNARPENLFRGYPTEEPVLETPGGFKNTP